MGGTVRLRARFSTYFSYVFIAMSLVVSGYITVLDPRELLSSVPFLLAIVLVVWVVFAHPHVEVGDGGITVVNVLTRHHVPWSRFTGVSTEWNLRVHAEGRVVTAWALPVSGGSARRSRRARRVEEPEGPGPSPNTAEGAALLIGEHHSARQGTGHQGGSRRDGGEVTRRADPAGVAGLALAIVLLLIGLG